MIALLNSHLSIEELKNSSEQELKRYIKGVNSDTAIFEIRNNFEKYQNQAFKELNDISNKGIKVVSYFDKNFPASFKQIATTPTLLYCKGDINLLQSNNNIAIIGMRKSSDVGNKIAKKTSSFFSQKGYTIISGLALGIDAAAHEGALDAKGKTVAFLTDVEKISPKENLNLVKKILDNSGLIVAENKPGSFIGKGSFVKRNRLQSAFSIAVFPIESEIKGGTMHTVKFAQEQNKLIYCPDVSKLKKWYSDDKYTSGVKMLINTKKATPFTVKNYDEIIERLELRRKELLDLSNINISSTPELF